MSNAAEAYTERAGDKPIQMNLFENQIDMSKHEYYEELLRKLSEELKESAHSQRDPVREAFGTFNLCPPRDLGKYLRKANIASSAEESIAGDWRRVFSHLYVSYLRQAVKVEQRRVVSQFESE